MSGELSKMNQANQKIMTVCFVISAFLVGLIIQVILRSSAGAFGVMAKLYSQDIFAHGLPVGLGLATFLYLQLNPKVKAWAEECIIEVRKVVWPSKKDTSGMTTVVCVMLVIASIILSVFDLLSGSLVKMVLG